ncbi:peroxidase 10-like isoform X2 [Andrographis paniculata]|uniref:peroxidase 10-like isoform X2 n=1 Tax=Andrographis paniculata TaxID=175694 RepID=UPI0021E932F0|nr:peroxidase 10-like isoform X2 [Andrographis paniculata]
MVTWTINSYPDASYYGKSDSDGKLSYSFYDKSCPNLRMIVRWGVWAALKNDTRIAASLLRLHFHDCFVDGCEGSILLDDTRTMKGEKNALPNRNSVRGFEVIDTIKADLEKYCPLTVSCVDVLALAAREAVALLGGPFWPVPLGRLDGLSASEKSANEQLPSPFEPLSNITAKFLAKGLDLKDVVVLSGGHTIGFAQCFTFKNRLFNFRGSGKPDPSLDSSTLSSLQRSCPNVDKSNNQLAPLDNQSTNKFDNSYYKNLVSNMGVLESDQALALHPDTAALVKAYSGDALLFTNDFASSMLKLGKVGVITENTSGQVRKRCGSLNY